jgi:hypothetical protein
VSRRAVENLVALVILFVFAAALYLSFDYGPRARLVPVPIAVLGILLVVVQMVWMNLRSADELHIDTIDLFAGRQSPQAAARAEGVAHEAADAAATSHRRPGLFNGEIVPFALVAAFIALIYVLGPIVAIFIFVSGYLYFSKTASIVRAIGYAAICVGAIYLMFGLVLDVDMNRGLAMPLINQVVRF